MKETQVEFVLTLVVLGVFLLALALDLAFCHGAGHWHPAMW